MIKTVIKNNNSYLNNIPTILGKVIIGKQLGRKLGYKTANILLNNHNIDYGVYKVNIIIDNIIYNGVGTYLEGKNLFETHIFDFNKDIYGKNIKVILLKKLRDNKKFNSLEELKENIKKDIEIAKSIKIIVLTFGTFDKLHPGHEYYLNNAKKYGDTLITIIGTDKNVAKIKGNKTKYNQEERKTNLEKLNISDIIVIGDEKNPLKWIEEYSPEIICLGYDQVGFIKYLEKYNKNIKIIRLKPFKEHIYKSSLIK